MKLLFDQNLSVRLIGVLADLYPGSEHVRLLGMTTADDEVIWNYARQHGFIIISKDSDFYHRSMRFSHPPKVVWVRMGNCATDRIAELLRTVHAELLAFEQDKLASFFALTEPATSSTDGHGT